jgi:hypothetical protein
MQGIVAIGVLKIVDEHVRSHGLRENQDIAWMADD